MTKQRYIFFTIVISILLSKVILTLSMDFMISSGTGWFPYVGDLYLMLPVLMPFLAFAAAITTMKKRRKTWVDVWINVLLPWLLLLFLYIWECSLKLGVGILAASVMCLFCVLLSVNNRLAYVPLRYSMKRLYYASRRVLTFFLIITLIPAGAYSKYRQQTEQKRLMQFVEDFTPMGKEDEVFDAPDESQWKAASAAKKMSLMEGFAAECFQELGIEKVPLWVNENMEKNNLACYDYQRDVIYINSSFLENDTLCTLKTAFYVVAHECFHVAQYQIVYSLMLLEEAGFNYEGMAYYAEAIELAEALQSYSDDRKNEQTYFSNELEEGARAYGKEKIDLLAEKYSWN